MGQFTYWSQRTFARPVNCGIRLDYFICSQQLFPSSFPAQSASSTEVEGCVEVSSTGEIASRQAKSNNQIGKRRELTETLLPVPGIMDCFIVHEDTVGCSDHCPVILVVRVA